MESGRNGEPFMYNILFINPVYNKNEVLGPFAKYITSQIPLTIGFLAGYLETKFKNIYIKIIDEQFKQLTEVDLENFINEYTPSVIGFTVYTLTAYRAYFLGTLIKNKWPHIKVVMGGVHATLLPDEPLEKGAADFVVRNEGEITLTELLDTIWNKKAAFNNIAGLSYILDGSICHNKARKLIENLDDLPNFPYHYFEDNISRYQFGNMLTTRGCPYECTFCSQRSIAGRTYRARSPEKVVEEMEILVNKYNQRWITFNNDNFIVNKKQVHRICDLIIQNKFPKDLKLGVNARGDAVTEDVLLHMRQAHFTTISFGLETGSERIMKLIKKSETVEDIERGVRIAKKCGFITTGSFIIGLPTETRKETIQTIKHAFKIPLDFARFNILVPYPGSEIYEIIQKDEIHKVKDWSNYATHSGISGNTIPYVPAGRTAKELLKLQWYGNLLFYLRPKQIFNISKLKYATFGQVLLPEPNSFKSIFELTVLTFRLIGHWLMSNIRKSPM